LTKVTIDGEEFNLEIHQTTQKVIESPSGLTVVQYAATLWKYLEE
tara:strand:+ start:477 stop:611 length:135 start_codon:yes stop_codon:yes gene_type:complete